MRAHGKTRVELVLDRQAFAYYSVAKDEWTVKPGIFEILVGGNCADTPLGKKVVID